MWVTRDDNLYIVIYGTENSSLSDSHSLVFKSEFFPIEDFDCIIEIIQSESEYTTLRSVQAITTLSISNIALVSTLTEPNDFVYCLHIYVYILDTLL